MEAKLISKKLFIVMAVCLVMLGAHTVGAAARIKGHLTVTYHLVPVLKDEACAYTTLSKPSKRIKDCSSKTTVKIYNKAGDYKSDSYSQSGGTTWDLPINAGAYAKIRGASKALGTHKAKSYDTGYKWVSTKNTIWKK